MMNLAFFMRNKLSVRADNFQPSLLGSTQPALKKLVGPKKLGPTYLVGSGC